MPSARTCSAQTRSLLVLGEAASAVGSPSKKVQLTLVQRRRMDRTWTRCTDKTCYCYMCLGKRLPLVAICG